MKRSRSLPPSHVACLSPRTVVYAVGDMHGRLDLLNGVIGEVERAAIEASNTGDELTVVFLGDYIDRGPAAKGVIDRLIELRDSHPCETTFLRGNHEQFLLDMIDGRAEGTAWLDYGGVETLRSYGVDWPASGSRDVLKLGERLRSALPPEHVQFLRDTKLFLENGDYIFVHAGLRPDRLLSEQSDADMLWFRYYSDDEPIHGKTVVHGHTPRARPVAGRWRIGIDTEAYDSGALTMLRLRGADTDFLKVETAPGGDGTRVSPWEAVDRPHDRLEPASVKSPPRQERTSQPKARRSEPREPRPREPAPARGGAMMAVGAVAVAAVLVVGVLVGLAWWFGGRAGPASPANALPVRTVTTPTPPPPGFVLEAPNAAAPLPGTPPAPGSATPGAPKTQSAALNAASPQPAAQSQTANAAPAGGPQTAASGPATPAPNTATPPPASGPAPAPVAQSPAPATGTTPPQGTAPASSTGP